MLLAREQLLIEEGREKGLAQGLVQGAEKERVLLIKHALQGCTPEDVSKLLGIPLHEILKVAHDV